MWWLLLRRRARRSGGDAGKNLGDVANRMRPTKERRAGHDPEYSDFTATDGRNGCVKSGNVPYHEKDSRARAWRNGIRSGLKENLSARRETGDAALLKFGETSNGNPEPSPERYNREGVETRRAAPKLRTFPGEGEGIVQTANLAWAPMAPRSGGESRRRYENPQGLNGP
jgi:hypothetical protein